MKSIKLQEEADKKKKDPGISKLAVKAKGEIEEDMPLKIKAKSGKGAKAKKEVEEEMLPKPELKSGGKLKTSLRKEIEPSRVLPTDLPAKSPPDKLESTTKKDAVFFK